jgi:hypothetical protein
MMMLMTSLVTADSLTLARYSSKESRLLLVEKKERKDDRDSGGGEHQELHR